MGEIDFGKLTPDMFVAPFIPYERCSDDLRTKILTISNSGEEDLTISSLTLPSTAFTSSWQGGVISPGTSVDVIITFNSASALGNHSSNITFSSDRTNTEPINIPVKAIYATRLCNVSVSTALLDFGMTGSNIFGRYFDVINNGNAPIGIIAAPLDWDGQNPSTGYGQYTHPDFSISSPTFTGPLNPICLQPGQSMQFQANFFYHGSGPSSTKTSLIVDECPNLPGLRDIISIQANVPVTRIINVTTSPSTTLPAFTAPSVTQNITVSNSGTSALTVTGFTTSPTNTMFSVSPTSFTIPAGVQQIVIH